MIIIMHQTYNKVQKLPKLRIVLSKLTVFIAATFTGSDEIVFHDFEPWINISVESK